VSTAGELKDEHHREGGVAYTWSHALLDDAVEKTVVLRFHDRRPTVQVVEPIVEEPGMRFSKVDSHRVSITGGLRELQFELLEGAAEVSLGEDEGRFWQPFPAVKCYPIVLTLAPSRGAPVGKVTYRISVK
jgi:hypothetical protein